MPIDVARPIIQNQPNGGELNVSPELSPDGSKLMFFSERDLFSIDLYLADARTGKVIRKITNTATNAHFESLQFLAVRRRLEPRRQAIRVPGDQQRAVDAVRSSTSIAARPNARSH